MGSASSGSIQSPFLGQRVENVTGEGIWIAKSFLVDRIRNDAFDGRNTFRVPRQMFVEIQSLIARIRAPPVLA
ncbi:MAG TPA: hypothetical protein VHS97_00955 [Isosphaeraceae bacterium]|nr:hypothetical protein [Isosphaeraceae bacterium]